MHVAVLGAGVTGVTAAHYLVESGNSVTLIDRESCVANKTSRANGGQLCYSFTDAMASPGFARRLPGLIAGGDPAIRVSPGISVDFARWGLSFLGQCTRRRANENTLAMLQMALHSQSLMHELHAELPGDFHFRKAGKLILLRTDREVAQARRSAELKTAYGCVTRILTLAEACEVEPAIRMMKGNYVAAVYSPGDEVGDARAFTQLLADRIVSSGRVNLVTDTAVHGLAVEAGRLRAVRTSAGEIAVDAAVACLGAWSSELLRPLKINPGIYPVRGYSITLPIADHTPTVSVTDLGKRFVISKLGSHARIAGFADFVGYDVSRDEERIALLTETARGNAPLAASYGEPDSNGWGGFRPMTASGRPLVGESKLKGLYLNTGHGSMGWTLACASGQAIADVVSEKDTCGDPRRA